MRYFPIPCLWLIVPFLLSCGLNDIPIPDPNPEPVPDPVLFDGFTSQDWPNPPWQERGIHISKTGSSDSDCGAEAKPCQSTIKQALANRPDDTEPYTIYVHPGLYDERYIYVKSYTRILGVQGAKMTKIFSGNADAVYFNTDITHAEIDGFEVYANYNGGKPTRRSGLIRVYNASNIAIKNCILHDAAFDADNIKVFGYVENLLMENLIVYNPAHRPNTNSSVYQENIDTFGSSKRIDGQPSVRNIVLRGSWLYHTPDKMGENLMYGKVDVENYLIENNIFGPSSGVSREHGEGRGLGCLHIGTGELGEGAGKDTDPREYEHKHSIVRNNIFIKCQGDNALSFSQAHNIWVYNNIFHDNSGGFIRAVIQFTRNVYDMGDIYMYNNVFQNNHPTRQGRARMIRVRNSADPALYGNTFYHDNNFYYDNISATDLPYTGESHGIYSTSAAFAVNLPQPLIPATHSLADIGVIKASFKVINASLIQDKGINPINRPNYPNWKAGLTDRPWDTLLRDRGTQDIWDLGSFSLE